MKWTLMVLAALLGGWAIAVTITPTSADFGKVSVGAFVTRPFTVSRSDTLLAIVSLEGPDADQFFVQTTTSSSGRGGTDSLFACDNGQGMRISSTCVVEAVFRPAASGVKTATLVVTDFHGQRASATLRGEAIVPACKLELVPCNWAISYIGGISILEKDSSNTPEHVAKYLTDLSIKIDQGQVTCSGRRNEFEQNLQDDKATDEVQLTATISGPGLAAIEFEPDANGKMTYTLSFACATPAGRRISRSLRFGTSETETVVAEPADWRNSQMVGVPQPATEQAMPLLEGKHLDTDWDPANKEGRVIRACWSLSRTGTRAALPTVGSTCTLP